MRKKARQTDTIIIIVLVILAAVIVFSTKQEKKTPAEPSEPIPMEGYNGKPMGVVPGSPAEQLIRERFPDSPIAYYSGFAELYAALITEKIDAFPLNEFTLRKMVGNHMSLTWFPEPLDTRYRYFGFAKTPKGEKLCAQMDEMLAEFRADGTLQELEEIWYGDDESRKVLDDSGLTGENGTLQVGVCITDEPYNYIRNDQLTGINTDIVTRFARRYGYAIEYRDTEPQGLLIGMKLGKYDMLATSIAYTEERAETILFSEPAIRFYYMLAIRQTGSGDGNRSIFESIGESFEKTFIRENRWKMIVKGIGTTCLLTFSSAVLGTALGFWICMFRRTGSSLAKIISTVYVRIMQGTPMVVVLLILYYMVFGKSNLAAVWIAVIGFTMHFGANTAEMLRSGIDGVPPGQREAALALGYDENQAFSDFILPQAVKRILPVYRSEIIGQLKGTAVAGYISVQDLTKMSDLIRSRTYEAFFPLIATALIYFLMARGISILLTAIMKLADRRHKGGNVR